MLISAHQTASVPINTSLTLIGSGGALLYIDGQCSLFASTGYRDMPELVAAAVVLGVVLALGMCCLVSHVVTSSSHFC